MPRPAAVQPVPRELRREAPRPLVAQHPLRLRRHHLLSRHNDAGYRRALAQLSPFQALELYKQVLTTVSAAYVDRARADLTRLFRQGLEELRFALDEDLFCKEYLSGNAQARATYFARRARRTRCGVE